MILLDSNVVISAANASKGSLLDLLEKSVVAVSAITRLEVLGYHRMNAHDLPDLVGFFELATVFDVTNNIIDRAISLRQRRRMSLGDALIAATALVEQLPLVTVNLKDFRWIPGPTLMDLAGD